MMKNLQESPFVGEWVEAKFDEQKARKLIEDALYRQSSAMARLISGIAPDKDGYALPEPYQDMFLRKVIHHRVGERTGAYGAMRESDDQGGQSITLMLTPLHVTMERVA